MMRPWTIIVWCGILVCSCSTPSDPSLRTSQSVDTVAIQPSIPAGFPKMHIPETNAITNAKVRLGERLFFDPVLSSDFNISCASCHLPAYAFSDTVALSEGAEGGRAERNAPSLINVGFHPHLMREGGVPGLELQILTPLESENEMNLPIGKACERLNQDSSYRDLFQNIFGDTATPFTLTRAIAAYERTLIGGGSDYDGFVAGDSGALSRQAKAGMQLFFSDRLKCSTCHSGVLFTDFSFRNNGTYQEYKDNGRFRLTLREEDIGKFKVPSLRNVALTAPYMFDGSIRTLDEVITHYAEGGHTHPNKDTAVTGFEINEQERAALIAFLQSLTERGTPES